MSFLIGFFCGLVVGATAAHLVHDYLDSALPKDTEAPDTPLWRDGKDDQ